MMRHLKYLSYVLRHKWFVLVAGISQRVPLLILIFHDWDKFLPDEWMPYARTFYKPNGSKQYEETAEFAYAWMLHQHRNKHHWQHHLKLNGVPLPQTDMLVWDRGVAQRVVQRNSGGQSWFEVRDVTDIKIEPDPMPDVYRREMLADWLGAGRAQGKPKTWEWYEANKGKMILHPETRAWIEARLAELKEYHRQLNRFKTLGF